MRSFGLASLFEERLVPDFVLAQSFGSFFNVAGELWLFLVRSVLLRDDLLVGIDVGRIRIEDHVVIRIGGTTCSLAHEKSSKWYFKKYCIL
jgi:hypothetical protein